MIENRAAAHHWHFWFKQTLRSQVTQEVQPLPWPVPSHNQLLQIGRMRVLHGLCFSIFGNVLHILENQTHHVL